MSKLSDLRPLDMPEYMTPAWLGCIEWAIKRPGIVAQFRAETSNAWMPGVSPVDRLIDKSTDAEWEFIKAFVEWANVNIWGPIDGPETEEQTP